MPQNIQLQACLADPDDVSEYRFLVNGKDIKYITVDSGVIPSEYISFEPVLKSFLPNFPPDDWNSGHVTKHQTTGDAFFATTTRSNFQGVENTWHGTKIDHLQLTWISRIRQNIRLITCSLFEQPVVYKFAEFPWQIPMMEAETTAYSWIHGECIGPRFLGHVTEAGRVMGFLIEYVPGRAARTEDLHQCQSVLGKLHSLAIKHGDINKHNFLIQEGKEEAVIVDFETMVRCHDKQELLREFEGLQEQLLESSGRGGVIEE